MAGQADVLHLPAVVTNMAVTVDKSKFDLEAFERML